MSLETDIAKFTSLVQDWSSKTSDTFYSDVAKDVTIKVINESGDIVDITIPNHAKMSDAFTSWKDGVDVQNVGGTLKSNTNAAVNVEMFGGLTLSEYVDMYSAISNNHSVKLMPLGTGVSMTPYHWFTMVTKANKIKVWGYNNSNIWNYGGATNPQSMMELNQPAEQQNVEIEKIYASGFHIAILYTDGKLYGRGIQSEGHFGIGNTSHQYKFILMAENVVEYNTSSHGDQDEQPSARLLKTDGSVWTAGDNGHGELGIGHTTNTYTWTLAYDPVANGNDKCVKVITEGDDVAYSFLVTESGKLYRTGYNGYGQLGSGNTTNITSYTQIDPATFDAPVQDVFLGSGYTDANYYGTTYVLTTTGRVYATGYNGYYQCATGNTTQQNSFNEIIYATEHNVATDPVVEIHYLWHAFYVITASRTMYGIGRNNYGHLGIGNTTTQSEFQYITNDIKLFHRTIGSDATDYPEMYVVKNDDTLWSCGYNGHGELGLDHTTQASVLTKVNFTHTNKIKSMASAGYSSNNTTYIELTDGTLYASGYNGYGNVTGSTADTTYVSHFSKVNF